MDKKTYFRVMLGVSIVVMTIGFIAACVPGALWGIMNFVLGFILLISGISAVISAIQNKGVQFIGILLALGILSFIFGLMLMLGKAGNFIGKLTVILFALWALMRGGILIFYGIQTKVSSKWRLLEIICGGLLTILAIWTAFNVGEAAHLAGTCIGISIIFDGIALLLFAFRIKNSDSIQVQVVQQVSQQEIGQDTIIIEETSITSNPKI